MEKKEYEAYKAYLKSAQNGNPEAMRIVGEMYDEGKGVNVDKKVAFDWYMRAAIKGDVRAMNNLGVSYWSADGVEQDYNKAMEWLLKAAEAGETDAMGNIGDMYAAGEGVTKDENEALKWYFKAVKAGSLEAMTDIAYLYYDDESKLKNPQKAFEWFSKAAEAGDPDAMYLLGKIYLEGDIVEKDKSRAINWLKKAAHCGDEDAIETLKELNENVQNDAPKNPVNNIQETKEHNKCHIPEKVLKADEVSLLKLAFEAECNNDFSVATGYYEAAMKLGSSEAAFNLGLLYANSSDKNLRSNTIAMRLFTIAHSCGYDASFNIIDIKNNAQARIRYDNDYREYNECQKLLEEIFQELTEKVKTLGWRSPDRIFNLAQLYCYGLGTEKSKETARELLKMAFTVYAELARKGSTKDKRQLAHIYLNGYDIIETDYKKAFSLYMQAAEEGDREAMSNIGDAYSNIRGWANTVTLDMNIAMQWYKRAADLGFVEAMRRIKSWEKYKQEFEEAKLGADSGDYKSIHALAKMYQEGKVIAKDERKALELFIKAYPIAKSSEPVKTFNFCGQIAYSIATLAYKFGLYSEARNWYANAIDDGDYHAMEKLAEMFRTGKGGRRDTSHADYIMEVRKEFDDASVGIVEAKYKIAYRYWKGDFVEENYAKALAWFKEIAEDKNIHESDLKYKHGALYNIACLYEEGKGGVNKDKQKAKELYAEAEKYKPKKKSSCFITTAVCDNFGKADDCYELTMFRSFRDNWLANQPEGESLINEYYRIAPNIVNKINQLRNAKEIYQQIWNEYLQPCLLFIENGKYLECESKYVEMVHKLAKLIR